MVNIFFQRSYFRYFAIKIKSEEKNCVGSQDFLLSAESLIRVLITLDAARPVAALSEIAP